MFALVDCDSFFASCEQIFRPDLRGKPIVVLSNNDGCIVARNRQAKALQVPDLVAYFKVKQLLEKQQIEVFSSNYELYGDISARVMDRLQDFATDMEIYSIDEAFLLLPDLNIDDTNASQNSNAYWQYGRTIKKTIWKDIRVPVSVGIGATKTLAKLASHIAKQSLRCQGVCAIVNLPRWQKVFSRIPVKKIWGIGRKYASRLQADHIYSVWQLLNCNPKTIQRRYSVNLERTVEELNGIPCYGLEKEIPDKQQIISSRSFGKKITELEPLQQAISQYASRACQKLRTQNALATTINVFIQTSRFEEDYYAPALSIKLPCPTNDTRTIIHFARQAVWQLYKPHRRYAKAGVAITEIISRTPQQLDFLAPVQSSHSENLMQVLDTINQRSGSGTAFFLAQGIQQKWKMNRFMKSPSYTTRWLDLPCIMIR
ncbi:MAG TPA: Y-family DNA polymerase [Aeromonadales bacterium]|nr:Y-family DNA polymerase [Aeromonadales bacterium]